MKNLGSVLTIIPAKGTSGRLKRKNAILMAGKPLIAYAIETAKKSKLCGEIMVSTEDNEIALLSKKLGATVPFMRPEYLSYDPYEVDDVCLHVLKQYEEIGKTFDTLIILLPTSPFCAVEDIIESIRKFQENDGQFLISVSKMDPHYYHAFTFDEQKLTLSNVFDDNRFFDKTTPPTPVRCNGAVTIVDIKAFKSAGTYYGQPLLGYEMPWERSVDIDTEQDLMFAEWLINKYGAIK